MSTGSNKPRDLAPEVVSLGLALIFLLALILRVYRLGHQSLWVDELITILQGAQPGHSLWEQFRDDFQSPLPMVIVAWMRQISVSEAWLRLPGALLGAFSPVLMYGVARRFGNARVALFAALLLAVHPLHVYHAQEVRGYSYLLFFGLAAIYAAVSAASVPTWRRVLAVALLGTAAALSNMQGLFWMGGLALGLLLTGHFGRHGWYRWGGAFALVLLLTSPWWSASFRAHESDRLLPTAEVGAPLRGETTFSPWALPYAGFVLAVGNSVGPTPRELREQSASGQPALPQRHLPMALVVAGLTVLLAGMGLLRLRGQAVGPLAWALVPVLLALLLAWRNVKPFNPRYVLAALPTLLLLVAAGMDRLPRRAGAIALAAWLVLSGLGLGRYYFVPAYGREDVRGAARLVEEREGGDDMVLAPTVQRVFEYYYRGRSPVRGHRHILWPTPDAIDGRLDALESEGRYLWFVRARPWQDDPQGYLQAELDRRYRRIGLYELPGVEVLLFDRVGDAPSKDASGSR